MRKPLSRRRSQTDAGVAAVEFVIVFPVLLFLLFGTINVMQDLLVSRRANMAAELVADVITRANTTIFTARVTDSFVAAQLALRPIAAQDIHVDVYDFFNAGNTATVRWQMNSAGGGTCPRPVINATNPNDPIGALLGDTNVASDVVVAVVCLPYVPPVANFPLWNQIFPPRTLVKTIAMRPRQSATLDLIP